MGSWIHLIEDAGKVRVGMGGSPAPCDPGDHRYMPIGGSEVCMFCGRVKPKQPKSSPG